VLKKSRLNFETAFVFFMYTYGNIVPILLVAQENNQ